MNFESFYYNCSPSYINTIAPGLYNEIIDTLEVLPKRPTQSEINIDIFWLLSSVGWAYDSIPSGSQDKPDERLKLNCCLSDLKPNNRRSLCLTTETIDSKWCADFAKLYEGSLVQLEVQFGKVEAMFKDFCGFRIGYAEKRLALGIEIVMVDPGSYFAHRKAAVNGMARFKTAKDSLSIIGLDCPIWLLGIKD